MRAVVQRVAEARVRVGDEEVAAIGRGLLVLLGVAVGDQARSAEWLADKVVGLRIFTDTSGKLSDSVAEAKGQILVVSQFTLYADTRKGRRPSFTGAAVGEPAERLYEHFIDRVASSGLPTQAGRFGADMQVALINDGPVTIILDSP
jgi:D-tyrosyl-tRNA(Tyr) deacylase